MVMAGALAIGGTAILAGPPGRHPAAARPRVRRRIGGAGTAGMAFQRGSSRWDREGSSVRVGRHTPGDVDIRSSLAHVIRTDESQYKSSLLGGNSAEGPDADLWDVEQLPGGPTRKRFIGASLELVAPSAYLLSDRAQISNSV